MVSFVLVMVASYFVHAYLQTVYYRQCKSTVFRVILYNNSSNCVYMQTVLHAIEQLYNNILRHSITGLFVPLLTTYGNTDFFASLFSNP